MRVSRAWVLLVVALSSWFNTGCLCDTTGPETGSCTLFPTFDVHLRNLDATGKQPVFMTTGDSYDSGYELGYKQSLKIHETEPGTNTLGVITGPDFTYRAFRADSLLRGVVCTKLAPMDEAMNAEVIWDGKELHCVGWK